MAVIYYLVFRLVIRRFNYPISGRGEEEETAGAAAATGPAPRARDTVAALGGLTNLRAVDACLTRMRVTVLNPARGG